MNRFKVMNNEQLTKEVTEVRKDIFGWFDSPYDTEPAHNPSTDTICPVCGNKLSAVRKTISLYKQGTERSYFYRVDTSCYNSMSEEEKNELDYSLIDNI